MTKIAITGSAGRHYGAFFAGVFSICLLITVVGCGSHDPVTIQNGNKFLQIEVWQQGKQVPRSGEAFHLKPCPFVLRLRGDVEDASYITAEGRRTTAVIEKLTRPLIFFTGTGAAPGRNTLHVMTKRIHLYDGNKLFFAQQWGMDDQDASKLADLLKEQFGTVPVMATFGHYYFPRQTKQEEPRYYLRNLVRLKERRLQGDFVIERIGNQPVGKKKFLRVLVFLDSQHIDSKFDFRREAWSAFDLYFDR